MRWNWHRCVQTSVAYRYSRHLCRRVLDWVSISWKSAHNLRKKIQFKRKLRMQRHSFSLWVCNSNWAERETESGHERNVELKMLYLLPTFLFSFGRLPTDLMLKYTAHLMAVPFHRSSKRFQPPTDDLALVQLLPNPARKFTSGTRYDWHGDSFASLDLLDILKLNALGAFNRLPPAANFFFFSNVLVENYPVSVLSFLF